MLVSDTLGVVDPDKTNTLHWPMINRQWQVAKALTIEVAAMEATGSIEPLCKLLNAVRLMRTKLVTNHSPSLRSQAAALDCQWL